MKAIICTKYGSPDVLQFREMAKPTPKDLEVLIKVKATTVNGADARIRGAVFPALVNLPARLAMGFNGPRKNILGVELAGVVESVGKDVSKFKVDDEVFASTGASFGAHAEYTCLSEKEVMGLKPTNMSFEEAAAVPHCSLAALHYLRKGNVTKGSKVMIYGAAGGIGTFAVQLAKVMGADVTGVCSSSSINAVKSLGVDKIVDYTKEDLAELNESFDVIFDTVGKAPIKKCVDKLKDKGMYLSAVHIDLPRIIEGIRATFSTTKKVIGGVAPYTTENLIFLKELIEEGKLRTVIDKTYPFEQIIEAHRYVDKGHKKGHVVVTFD